MKSLFAISLLLSIVTTITFARADTNAVTGPTKTSDASKTEEANQTAKSSTPYPVTAIVVSNTITFPTLLSKNSEALMTNAVYRRTFGRKVIFAADLSVKSFDIDQLHPSVIAQLDLDPNKAKADQSAMDQKNRDWAVQNQQQNQQYFATEAAALAKSQAAAQAAATNHAGRANPGDPNATGAGKHHRKTTTSPATPAPAN